MKELKQEATELGLDFKGNISKADLQAMVDEQKQVANDSPSEEPKLSDKKVKIIVSPRDSEEHEGYARLNGYVIQYKFEEEIEVPEYFIEWLKGKGSYIYDGKGNKKWVSRYLVEIV